jgi:predicted transcriptional regulator
MDHIAILNKSWKLLPKILKGEKTIESRWYKARYAPWDKIFVNDTIYFKNAGESIKAKCKVANVIQFDNLNDEKFSKIISKYGKDLCLEGAEYKGYFAGKKYCVLVFLQDVVEVSKPFDINKKGFGNACAWMVVDNIEKIRI